MISVVSPVVNVAVLPVFTVGVVVVVVPVVVVVVGPVPVPVPVPVGAMQVTLVAPTVQFVLKFERPFNVLLTQPDILVAAINKAKL